jgi:hypothetical protein
MPIDPSIALHIRPPEGPLDSYAKALAVQSALQQNKLAGLQGQQLEQGIADENRLREILSQSGGDLEAASKAALTAGAYKPAIALQKTLSEQKKLEAEQRLSQLKATAQQFQMVDQTLGNARSPQEYAAGRQFLASQNIDISNTPETYDPNFIEQKRREAIPIKDQIANEIRLLEAGLNRGVTMRGQDLTNARARETASRDRIQYDAERGVIVNKDTGEATSVTQGGQPLNIKSPTKLTEAQGKANLYATRATESDKIIADLEGKYSPYAINVKEGISNSFIGGPTTEAIANKALSKESQKAEQAQRNFVNAILRQESGAVISPSEFSNARRQYFPQPGDSQEVIEQKKSNRQTAIEGLRTMAGPAGSATNSPPSQQTARPRARNPQTGAVVEFDGNRWIPVR